MDKNEQIYIGVSSCLLGHKVRHDGQHKYHWYISEILGKHFEFISVCPEAEIGMGTPRNTVRLVGTLKDPAMIDPKTGKNWTPEMIAYSRKKLSGLKHLSGYIFKKGSPSCGVFRTKVYQKNGIPLANGRGLFSSDFMKTFPLLPVEEEGRLNDHRLRENFIERVFGYHRLKKQLNKKFSRKSWIEFHQKNKFLLLSHSRVHYTTLGKYVAKISEMRPEEFKDKYSCLYMETMAIKTTPKKHTDAMMHIFGFLKKILTSAQKKDLLDNMTRYKNEIIPLIVPITLLSHYIKIYDVPYVKDQYYLQPHPADLSLRNHV